ncbi:MAG TPA: rod shape-determining protein MreD [Thermoanaerobacterales bacterium]|nr:rod shape-determining protein MreD [Thermoanaerobacterales bacterium]
MKKVLIKCVFLCMIYVLQSSIFSFVDILGVRPDFLLGSIIAVSLQSEDIEGGIYGLVFGLLQDLHFGYIIGIGGFSKFVTGYLTGYYTRILFKSNILLPFVVGFAGSILHECIIAIIMYLTQFEYSFSPNILKTIIPYAFLNALICVLTYNILRKIENSLFKHKGVVG